MQLSRYVGFVDLGVAVVVAVGLLLPAREMYASPAQKAGISEQRALALAEARTMAHPDDGAAVDDFARQLGATGFKDWSIEAAVRGSDRAKASPTRWRALLAASVAYVDRLEVVPALDYANRALTTCADAGEATCPSWEKIRMELYQRHLDAGVKSGIDPRKGPAAVQAFRRAGESALRQIHLGGRDRSPPAPAAGAGAGSAR